MPNIQSLHTQERLRLKKTSSSNKDIAVLNEAYFDGVLSIKPGITDHINENWLDFLDTTNIEKKKRNYSQLYEIQGKNSNKEGYKMNRERAPAIIKSYGLQKHSKFQRYLTSTNQNQVNSTTRIEIMINSVNNLQALQRYNADDNITVSHSIFLCLTVNPLSPKIINNL